MLVHCVYHLEGYRPFSTQSRCCHDRWPFLAMKKMEAQTAFQVLFQVRKETWNLDSDNPKPELRYRSLGYCLCLAVQPPCFSFSSTIPNFQRSFLLSPIACGQVHCFSLPHSQGPLTFTFSYSFTGNASVT